MDLAAHDAAHDACARADGADRAWLEVADPTLSGSREGRRAAATGARLTVRSGATAAAAEVELPPKMLG